MPLSHCQYCGKTGNKEEILKKHKEHCPQYPLPCPNGCELGVSPSVGIAEHKKLCPLELIQCDYHDIGCKGLIARKELKDHYKQNVPDHLGLVKHSLASVVDKMEKRLEKHIANTEKIIEHKMKTVEGRITKLGPKMRQSKHLDTGMECYNIIMTMIVNLFL